MDPGQRFAEAAGEAYRRWRRGAHRFEAETRASFEVPGLEEALGVRSLPRDVRMLLEALGAGMASRTEGERDAEGSRRRVFTLEATPDRPAMRCTVVDAPGLLLYSRDGTRFGVLGAAVAPAETEAALERVDDVAVEGVLVEDGSNGMRSVRATLDADAVRGLVDVGRILGGGARATAGSGAIEAVIGPGAMSLRLRVEVMAAADVAEAIGFSSETVLRCRDLEDPTISVALPRAGLSMPGVASLQHAFRLATPRGARATKRRRR